MPVLNFKLSHIKTLVSSTEILSSARFFSKYCLPINHDKGVMSKSERRGISEVRESSDWESNKIKIKERPRVIDGGF